MRTFFFVLMLLFSFIAQASFEDHFKKAEGKSPLSQMRNIDFIYMINLDERPQKYASCLEQLLPYGIHPYRFSAVNGWKLSLEAINEVGVEFQTGMQKGIWGAVFPLDGNGTPRRELIEKNGEMYFCDGMVRGAIGIVLSHLSILQDAYDSMYETIWVMEDDIEVVKDPRFISDLIDLIDEEVGKENWDILFTDRDTKDQMGNNVICRGYSKRPNFKPKNIAQYLWNYQVSSSFRRLGARFGAYSMIIRRSGMVKLLDFFKKYKVFLPYDMDFYLPPGMQMYTVLDDVVSTQPQALSDNAYPGYLEGK